MWKFSLAISYFLFVSTIVRAIRVDYCDYNAKYEVKVKGVDISPYPGYRGERGTVSISANTDYVISSANLVIEVSYFGTRIHSETLDLCDETKCPVATGDFLVSFPQVLPGHTPPGSYSIKMKMLDEYYYELTCIRIYFDNGFGSSVADI